jgi:hypothetical protein
MIQELAIQAVEALVHLDVTVGRDRLDRAASRTQLAARAALRTSLEHVRDPELPAERHDGAERAQEAAECALDEEADSEQREGVDHERPRAVEPQRDDGLEGLHLGGRSGRGHRVEGERDDAGERHVLRWSKQPVGAPRWTVLRHPDRPRDASEELLQGAERAQPSAEDASAPHDEASTHEDHQEADERFGSSC